MSEMWYCPNCVAWNGSELDQCLECERDRPRVPVTTADVDVDDARNVTTSRRVAVKVEKLLNPRREVHSDE